MTQDQGDDMGNTEDQPNVEEASKHDWFKNPKNPPTLNRRQVVSANYFFNNDLEYLKGGSSSGKYTTSTTKTKADKYDNIEGIEDMVQMLWSPVKKSSHDVFFTKRIISVTYVNVVKKYDYGYLDEIIVRREDHKLYKFKEGDFPRLNLHDIEDMLLL
ncbi:hypothetical protein Tco_0770822 [Tanacetum coccineum]|uniref:Uncharacterized protein n=1 Tax=Tanacetum coccineum TaxID=301880 RepID=A0ABQ4ZFY6_9ASTR